MKLNLSKEWRHEAGANDECMSVSAGNLTLDALILDSNQPERAMPQKEMPHLSFAKLINLKRRERELTLGALAEQAGIDLVDMCNIELEAEFRPETPTVFRLAETLKLPQDKLLQLSGVKEPANDRFREKPIRFDPQSALADPLTPEEHDSLCEFVKYLSEN